MNNYDEKHKLPLSFKYAEVERKSKTSKTKIHFVECDKYQTEFLSKGKPNKSLVRLL